MFMWCYVMIKKINLLLVLSLLLFVSISAVSAMEDTNSTMETSDETIVDMVESNDSLVDEDTLALDSSEEVLSSSITVNKDNYQNYFDSNGNVLSTVNSGDTVRLDGSFSKCDFIFNKKVTVEGTSSNSLSGCTVKLLSGASGSTILNLKIRNTANYQYGICLDGADNCVVKNCFINNTGQASYPIAIGNAANNNLIADNTLVTYGETYGHGTRSTPSLVVFGSEYNTISNNRLYCDDANGIYFSNFGAGPFSGGESNHNTVFNNTVTYNVIPTSWSYGIQVMGSHNTIDSNTIYGAYRGISTSTSYDGGNIIVNNRVVNLRGLDFSTMKATGGENGIVGTYNSIIKNNRVENSMIMGSGSGITALDNSVVENNHVQIVESSGKGINAYGSNVTVRNNNVTTVSGVGIYQEGYQYGLVVENNRIYSQTGYGVLLKKASNKERPFNVTITGNTISTGADYIIDASDVDKDSYYLIKNNVGGNVIDPTGSYNADRPGYEYNISSIKVVTPENYNDFIDENGNLKSTAVHDKDILSFNGVFSNKEIKVSAPIKITGNNPIFYNTTFKVTSGGVWIENLTIINQKSRINNWGIVVNKVENGVTIFNNKISVDDLKAAYAIYIVESAYVDVINNTLYSSGDFLTYTLLTYHSSDSKFINNTISTNGTGEVYLSNDEYCLDGEWVCLDGEWLFVDGVNVCIDGDYVNKDGKIYCLDGNEVCLDGSCLDGSHVIPEIKRTYGILMLYSSYNEVSNNRVNVTSKLEQNNIPITMSTNTIIGIDLYYNSHNNVFSQNDVFVKGNDNYIYGMGVLGYYTGHNAPKGQGASNNQFVDNNIALEGNYFATGIIIGDESENTTVKNNVIDANAVNVTYGITLELSHNSIILNNNVTLNSNIVYGVESEISNGNNISGNDFKLNAKKVYGIGLNNAVNNHISNNKIVANSTGEEIIGRELDSISGPYSGILLMANSTGNVIEGNNITSTKGYAINIGNSAKNNLIYNNYLVSELGYANRAVNNSADNDVYGNYIYLIDGTLSNVQAQYLEFADYTFSTSLDGAKVDFYVGDVLIGSANVDNGFATISYRLEEDYTPASYGVHAVVSKEDYQTTGFDSTLEITKGNLNVIVSDISVKDGLDGRFSVKVVNALGKPVSNIEVIFYRGSQPIGSAVSDKNGVAAKVTSVPRTLKGTFVIKAETTESDYYLSGSGNGTLTILDVAPVNLQVDNELSIGGILATFTDNNGFAIASKKVSVKIGSTLYSLKTDSKGQIALPGSQFGSYKLNILFDSDSDYENVNYNGKINILKPLTGNKDSSVFYGSTVTYKVHAVGANGNAVVGQIVKINVNGKSYNVKTDKNGYATYNIKLGVGKYTVTASYNGFKVSNKITFKPTLSAKNIVKKKSKKIKFSAKLVDKNGKALKNKKITFKIKGKKYKVKTNKKGVATLTLKKLKVGNYKITSSYGGCTIKNTIKIKK